MRPSVLLAPLALSTLLTACAAAPAHTSAETTAAPAHTAAPSASSTPAPSVPAPLENGRLPELARPVRYELALDVDPSRERFGGAERITLAVPHPTRAIVMHSRGPVIRRASLTLGGATFVGTPSARSAAGGRGEPEELVLTFDREVPAGEGTLEIAFDAPFDRSLRGLYRVQSGGRWYGFTQFEANDARRAFPCFDEPGFKVPWTVSLTVPEGQLAVANMPETEHTPNAGAHTTTFRFAQTPPTPSYLVAFAVGPLQVVEGPRTPVPIRAITVQGQNPAFTRLALEAAAAHVDILAHYFDRAYPYPKLDLVAVPEFGAGAMENPGLITFREELLLLDPEHAPTNSRRAMASVVAHELAHHWFGDLVTMAWWDDIWLNEGFATWMQARVMDAWRPAMNARVEALGGRAYAMEVDSLPAARAVRQPVRSTSDAIEAFDAITYQKGGAVLSMLESWLGEDTFRAGIRAYVHSHEWGNATAQDLFRALGEASHKDVAAVAETFLDRPGVPLVHAELDCPHAGAPTLVLSQRRYEVAGASGGARAGAAGWHVPVCVQFEAGATARRACTVLEGEQARVPLEGATACPRWLFPNADEAGYYRYEITPVVRAVAQPAALRSLDVRARAGFVQNAWALVRGGVLGADEFLRIADGFRGERARPVVVSLIDAFGELYDDVADPALRPAVAAWVGNFLRPIARELGWDPRPNDDDERKLLRRAVLGALGNLAADPSVLAEADRRTERYLHDPRSVDADVAALAAPLASRRADGARLDALLAALGRAPTPADRVTTLSAMGAFDDLAVLRRALDATVTDAVRVQDVLRVIYGANAQPAHRAAVVAWVHEHFDALRARLPESTAGRLAGLSSGACTREEMATAEAFWRPRVGQFEGAERALREGLERADQCVALRSREHDRLAAFLAQRPTASAR